MNKTLEKYENPKVQELLKKFNNLDCMYPCEYPSYQEREKAKSIGWPLFSELKIIRDYHLAVRCLLNSIVWAHYWRCRENIEERKNCKTILRKIRGKHYYTGYELDIDHYTRNWLWANSDLLCKEILEYLKEYWGYEPEENKFMKKGYTEYTVVL